MPINPIDAHRGLKINSPLGEELICRSFSGQETLGRLFDYKLDLFSLNRNIQFQDIVGQRVTITLELPHGERYFDGYVTEFRYMGTVGQFASYQATLKPWLWFLTRTADCRIFQNKKVPDIIKEVFGDNRMSDFEDKLSDSYREWGYCVQYRETDFNFISRLMEQEGIYYYFKHEMGKHTLVFADGPGAHEATPGYETVPFFPPDPNAALRERDHIQQVTATQVVMPDQYAIKDFDFENPKVDLSATLSVSWPHAYPMPNPEIFDFPGEYKKLDDGEDYVEKMLQELQAQQEQVHAGGSARGMSAGCLFTLENYPRDDLNKEYLIVSVKHDIKSDPMETSGSAGAEGFYSCQLEISDSSQQYRSERITPKPIVQGLQIAIVVGPEDDEIYCDEYARVKVQFPWDRYGENDQNSSCWMRVSQLWAGKKWGGIHIPRIGQEVLVSFLEGEPDQPLITGRVYNANNMPPYDLPANKTQSGIKSRSTKGGRPKDFNEFRFEDKKDKEQIYLHAEKDLTTVVENHEHRRTYNTRIAITGSSKNERPADVIEELSVHGTRMITIRGDDGLVVMDGDRGRKVQIRDGDYELEVQKGDYLLGVTEGNAETTIKKGSFSVNAGGDIIMNAGGKVTVEAKQSIELKVGGSSIVIDNMGVTITGSAKVDIKAPTVKTAASILNTIKGALVKIN